MNFRKAFMMLIGVDPEPKRWGGHFRILHRTFGNTDRRLVVQRRLASEIGYYWSDDLSYPFNQETVDQALAEAEGRADLLFAETCTSEVVVIK